MKEKLSPAGPKSTTTLPTAWGTKLLPRAELPFPSSEVFSRRQLVEVPGHVGKDICPHDHGGFTSLKCPIARQRPECSPPRTRRGHKAQAPLCPSSAGI